MMGEDLAGKLNEWADGKVGLSNHPFGHIWLKPNSPVAKKVREATKRLVEFEAENERQKDLARINFESACKQADNLKAAEAECERLQAALEEAESYAEQGNMNKVWAIIRAALNKDTNDG